MSRKNAVALLAELKVGRVHAAAPQPKRRSHRFGPRFRMIVDVRSSFYQRLRARKIRLDFAAREWPTRPWQPVTLFEIDGIERAAPSAPVIAASAKVAESRIFERNVRDTVFHTGIEPLRRRIEFSTAALEQEHAERRSGKRNRK